MLLDVIDNLVLFISNYGSFVLLFFAIIKLALIIWYKPHRLSFARKHYFRVFTSRTTIPSRERANVNWIFFRTTHNIITITTYAFGGLWIVLYIIMLFTSMRSSI